MKIKLWLSALVLPLTLVSCEKKSETEAKMDHATEELKAAVEKAQENLTPEQRRSLEDARKTVENFSDEQKEQLAAAQKAAVNMTAEQKEKLANALSAAGSDMEAVQKAALEAARKIQEAAGK